MIGSQTKNPNGPIVAKFRRSPKRTGLQVAQQPVCTTTQSVDVTDPFNGTTNPKAIPGARVTYTLDLSNTGSGTADNVILRPQQPYTKRLLNDVLKIYEEWDLSTVESIPLDFGFEET